MLAQPKLNAIRHQSWFERKILDDASPWMPLLAMALSPTRAHEGDRGKRAVSRSALLNFLKYREVGLKVNSKTDLSSSSFELLR
jgi:hypothetical protein